MSGHAECRRIRSIVERVEVGMASPQERAQVAQHLAVCPACARWADAAQQLNRLLQAGAEEPPAPEYWEDLTDRVLRRALQQRFSRQEQSWSAMVAAALLLVAGLFVFHTALEHTAGPSLGKFSWLAPRPEPVRMPTTPTWKTRPVVSPPAKATAFPGVIEVGLVWVPRGAPESPRRQRITPSTPGVEPSNGVPLAWTDVEVVQWEIPAPGISSPALAAAPVQSSTEWSRRESLPPGLPRGYGLDSILRHVGAVASVSLPLAEER